MGFTLGLELLQLRGVGLTLGDELRLLGIEFVELFQLGNTIALHALAFGIDLHLLLLELFELLLKRDAVVFYRNAGLFQLV